MSGDGYDPAEVRRVLLARNSTVPVKDRGRLSDAAIAEYDRLMAEEGAPDDAYMGGVTRDDFDGPDDPAGFVDELDDQGDETIPSDVRVTFGIPDGYEAVRSRDGIGGPERPREQVPRSAVPSARARARSLWARRPSTDSQAGGRARSRGQRKRRARPRHEWVPTAPMIERMWAELAMNVRRLPPLQRVLACQAPMAGMILQDVTNGTIVDRLLQPLARGEERLEGAHAMLGPPMWTALITRFGGVEVKPVFKDGQPVMVDGRPLVEPQTDPDTGEPIWNDPTRVMIGGLRMSLMSWLRISARHAEEIIAHAEELDELGAQADMLIRFILQPPVEGQTFSQMQREARDVTRDFLRSTRPQSPPPSSQAPAAEDLGSAADPAPATPGHGADVARGLGWPPGAEPDARTFAFTPPDPRIASQVAPRAPMPQA